LAVAARWRWVGRVRGRDFVKLKSRWRSCKRVFEQATTTPTALGIGEWVRSNPLRAAFVLVRKPKQGPPGQDGLGQAQALEEEPASRPQCP
jgi:hypothetical protein